MQPRGSTIHSVFPQRMEPKGYKMVYGDHGPEKLRSHFKELKKKKNSILELYLLL